MNINGSSRITIDVEIMRDEVQPLTKSWWIELAYNNLIVSHVDTIVTLFLDTSDVQCLAL